MPNRTEAAQRKLRHVPPGDYGHCACSRLHTKPSGSRLTLSDSVQAIAGSALHFDRDFSRSGRLSPSW